MQLSLLLSSKSYNTNAGLASGQDYKNPPGVNWISVISFLENQYTKSSIRQKEWFLEKKILNEQILKLRSELTAMQRLNSSLNNRIKLLENALKKQKLLKQPNQNIKQQKNPDAARTTKQIEKYFEKNGWTMSEKPANLQQSHHKKFLTKVLDQVGIKVDKIDQKRRKMSMASVETQKVSRTDHNEKFQSMINELNRVKISSRLRINAHLDSVRGILATKSTPQQTLLVSVSQDCLVKQWNINPKPQKTEPIQPSNCFRQHTGQLFTIDGGSFNQGINDLVMLTAGTEEYVKVWYTEARDEVDKLKCIGWFSNQKNDHKQEQQQLETEIIWNLKYKNKKLLTSASDGIVRLFTIGISRQQNLFISDINLANEFSQKGYLQTATEWVGYRGFLAACSNFSKIFLWDIQKAKILQRYFYEIEKPIDDKNNPKKQPYYSNLFQINSLKYSSDTKLVYAGCEDKSMRIFSYDQTKIVKKLDTGVNDSISCIDIYKSNYIIAGCLNGFLKVWDRRTYRLLIDEQSHKTKYDEGILCVTTTEDGIFTGGADGIINFYQI